MRNFFSKTFVEENSLLRSLGISAILHIALFAAILNCGRLESLSYSVLCGSGGLVVDYCSAAEFMGLSAKQPIQEEEATKAPVEDKTQSKMEKMVVEDKPYLKDENKFFAELSDAKPVEAEQVQQGLTKEHKDEISHKTVETSAQSEQNREDSALPGANSRIGAISQNVSATPLKMAIVPYYPIGARMRGEEGVVKVKVLVAENGSPLETIVLASSGFKALDQAAVKAVSRAKFKPAYSNGKPIRSEALLSFRFCLEN